MGWFRNLFNPYPCVETKEFAKENSEPLLRTHNPFYNLARNRYKFRGLLAKLRMQLDIVVPTKEPCNDKSHACDCNGAKHSWGVQLVIPDVEDVTGHNRYPVNVISIGNSSPDIATLDLAVTEAVKRALTHEVDEGLFIDGRNADPHNLRLGKKL